MSRSAVALLSDAWCCREHPSKSFRLACIQAVTKIKGRCSTVGFVDEIECAFISRATSVTTSWQPKQHSEAESFLFSVRVQLSDGAIFLHLSPVGDTKTLRRRYENFRRTINNANGLLSLFFSHRSRSQPLGRVG